MPSPHAQINPRLIAALTGKPSNAIKPKPTKSMLPGKYTKQVAANMNKIEPRNHSNEQYLICKHCGKKGKYDLGMVLLDSQSYLDNEKVTGEYNNRDAIMDHIQATGYFRCKHCNGASHWNTGSPMLVFSILGGCMNDRHDGVFSTGKLQLYDGTFPRWCTDGEDHLLDQIFQNPEDSYIWDRLGNLYHSGGRPELAAAAYEKSLDIDQFHIESLFSLADFLMQLEEWEAASYHYRKLFLHARNYDRIDAEKLRELLAEAMSNAMTIHLESDQQIPFLPSKEESEQIFGNQADNDNPHRLKLLDFELSTEDTRSFYGLAEAYMGTRAKELPAGNREMSKTSGSSVLSFSKHSEKKLNKKVRIKGQLKKKKKRKRKK
jgi:tetratricopeptide (TPR) repeat protein